MGKSKEIKLNLPKGKSLALYLYLAAVMLYTMLFFNYFLDMGITAWHANDFLDNLFSGKGLNFYRFVYDKAAAGNYFGHGVAIDGAIYSPIVYLILGILILPIYLCGKIMDMAIEPSLYAEFLRLEMIGFSIWAATLTKRILEKQGVSSSRFLFLSSPFFLYCVVACNQYDVIVVVIALYALKVYLDGNMWKSTALIAASAILKPFALLMFIPLVLYKEKNVIKAALYLVVSVVPMGLLSVMCKLVFPVYSQMQTEMHEYYSFGDQVFDASIQGGMGKISLFVLFYCIVCVVAFIMKPSKEKEFRAAVLLGLASYMTFFLFVYFHGQWGIYILPFLVMAIAITESKVNALLMTIGFEGAFAVTMCHITEMRIMIGNSIMGANFQSPTNDWEFYRHYFDTADIPFSFMVGFGVALMIVLILDYIKGEKSEPEEAEVKTWMLAVKASTILLFTVPPVMCFLGVING